MELFYAKEFSLRAKLIGSAVASETALIPIGIASATYFQAGPEYSTRSNTME